MDGNHVAKPLDGLLGQPVAHLGECASTGDGGLGFELRGLHDFVADRLLVGPVNQGGFGDFAAQAHGALAGFAHDILLRLEEATQSSALVFIQVPEEFLRIELRVARPALAFTGAEVASRTIHRTTFAAGRAFPPGLFPPGLFAAGIRSGPRLLATAFVRAEVAARWALAFSGTFFTRSVFARAFIPTTLLGGSREGKPA